MNQMTRDLLVMKFSGTSVADAAALRGLVRNADCARRSQIAGVGV